jgi:ComF family protein
VLARTLFQEFSQALLDLLFPPRCVNCKTADGWLCQNCLSNISFINPPVCKRCGTPVPVIPTFFCSHCENNPLQYIDGIRAASYFENNPIRPAIHFLKYSNHKAVACILGEVLADAYRRYKLMADVVVPVTLHTARFRERGYNQSELLATQVAEFLELPANTKILQRTRNTKSQVRLRADERYQNVANAFACRNNKLSGHTVLLIDDVCTTGSTLDACANALKQSGVASVWGLTLAKAH